MALVRRNFVVNIMILFCIVATSKARNSLTLQAEKELSLENTPAIRKDLKVLPSPTNNALATENNKNLFDAYSKSIHQIECSGPSQGGGGHGEISC